MRPAIGNCYNSEPWGCGPSAVVEIPPPKGDFSTATGSLPYSNLVLDYALECNTNADISCPQWDHVIQMKACCSPQPLRAATSIDGDGATTCNAQDGFELGRWITSFGRGNGRWRTDVTPWLPLLRPVRTATAMSYCNVTLYTVPWAGNQGQIPWLATLSVRFENSSVISEVGERSQVVNQKTRKAPMPSSVLTPWQNVSTNGGDGIYTLFKWIAFNQSYETYFSPVLVNAPKSFAKAELVTVLSGSFVSSIRSFPCSICASVSDLW